MLVNISYIDHLGYLRVIYLHILYYTHTPQEVTAGTQKIVGLGRGWEKILMLRC